MTGVPPWATLGSKLAFKHPPGVGGRKVMLDQLGNDVVDG